MTDRILDKVVLFALIAQIGFILYMNLFRADTIIDYDSSSAYLHEMEMGGQGRIFPLEYEYQGSLDLDSASLISAALYRFTGDIFLSRGIANTLVIVLYICVVSYILDDIGVSKRWKCFGILLFLIPYSMIMLGYWRMLFAGGGFFALRALVPLLVISLIGDFGHGKAFRKSIFRMILLFLITFLNGLSSGPYILLCAVCPLFLWEAVRAFLQGDYGQMRSKRTAVAAAAAVSAVAGIVLQKALGFSTIADQKYILTSNKWIDALQAAFAGIFELFGGLTIHEEVSLFSAEAIGTAVNFAATCILLSGIVYTAVKCIKKKAISDRNGYIFSLMLVNLLMFCFADLKYGENVFESRYHLVPMLPAFLLLTAMLEDLSAEGKMKEVQRHTIQAVIAGIFAASMLYGDAQWWYAKKALETEKLKELSRIIEEQGVSTAFVVGDDSKVFGRKLRVYGRDTHYIVLSDGAASTRQTTFGGTTRYLDNSMQSGKAAVIATPKACETLPAYLLKDMEYLTDYEGLRIYIAKESCFDCVGGIVAEKDRVVDFPYSPGYAYENARLEEDGTLVMKAGGGRLVSDGDAAEGTWVYTVCYDMPETSGDAYMEITAGEDDPVRVLLDPAAGVAASDGVGMRAGEKVRFAVSAPEGTVIRKIEISRKE